MQVWDVFTGERTWGGETGDVEVGHLAHLWTQQCADHNTSHTRTHHTHITHTHTHTHILTQHTQHTHTHAQAHYALKSHSVHTIQYTYTQCTRAQWIQWHPQAHVLLAGTSDGGGWMWRVPSGECKTLQGQSCRNVCAAIMPDGMRATSLPGHPSIQQCGLGMRPMTWCLIYSDVLCLPHRQAGLLWLRRRQHQGVGLEADHSPCHYNRWVLYGVRPGGYGVNLATMAGGMELGLATMAGGYMELDFALWQVGMESVGLCNLVWVGMESGVVTMAGGYGVRLCRYGRLVWSWAF